MLGGNRDLEDRSRAFSGNAVGVVFFFYARGAEDGGAKLSVDGIVKILNGLCVESQGFGFAPAGVGGLSLTCFDDEGAAVGGACCVDAIRDLSVSLLDGVGCGCSDHGLAYEGKSVEPVWAFGFGCCALGVAFACAWKTRFGEGVFDDVFITRFDTGVLDVEECGPDVLAILAGAKVIAGTGCGGRFAIVFESDGMDEILVCHFGGEYLSVV